MALHLAGLLADPPPATGRLHLTGARLFDAARGRCRPAASLLVEDGEIARVGDAADAIPDGRASSTWTARRSCPA